MTKPHASLLVSIAVAATCMMAPLVSHRAVGEEPSTPRAEIGMVPFDQGTVLEYRITMPSDLLHDMQHNGNDEEYRAVALHVSGGVVDMTFERVGFRLKGFGSLHSCWDESGVRSFGGDCARISTKIKFSEFDKDARFYGSKRLNLNAMANDNSKLREALAYSIFREFGVDAPRTAFAKLYVNGAGPFLVLAVEQIDGRYTAHHYPDGGDGNLYKEIWPRWQADEAMALEQLKTNDNPEDHPDVSDFLAFSRAVGSSSAESFATDMETWVDTTQLLRYMAVDRAIRNWDGLTTFYNLYPTGGPIPEYLTILESYPNSPHNFYWYHDDGAEDRFHLIPWDLDNSFWPADPFRSPQRWGDAHPVPDWNVKPASCAPIQLWGSGSLLAATPPGCDKLLSMLASTMWDDFVRIGNELIASQLGYDQLNAKLTAWETQIRPLVEADPQLSVTRWRAEVGALRSVLQTLAADFARHLAEGYIVQSAP